MMGSGGYDTLIKMWMTSTIFIITLTFIFGVIGYQQYTTKMISLGISVPTSYNPEGNYTLSNSDNYSVFDTIIDIAISPFAIFLYLFWFLYLVLSAITLYKVLLPSA